MGARTIRTAPDVARGKTPVVCSFGSPVPWPRNGNRIKTIPVLPLVDDTFLLARARRATYPVHCGSTPLPMHSPFSSIPTRVRSLLLQFLFVLAMLPCAQLAAHPRMIAYDYQNCIQCHVAPQGRGLLNSYGRGIDMEQSLSQQDFTGRALGAILDPKYADDSWNGRFGPVLLDFIVTNRVNYDIENTKAAAVFSGIYRQTIFLGKKKNFRISTEVGLRDSALADTALAPGLSATGGRRVFLKKAMLEWRLKGKDGEGGSEIAIGRDYLPIGLQLDDYTSYLLFLNRDGIYDFPLQIKYHVWREKWLTSVYLYGPTFDERGLHREWGGGFLYEYYPSQHLALGVQSLAGASDESDRFRLGTYARLSLGKKWALLAAADYTHYWDASPTERTGGQFTGFLQLYHHHTMWLVSSITGNYAYSDLLTSGQHHFSGRYTLSARLNRNLTLALTYAAGDIRRNLSYGQEAAAYANIKF